MRNLKLAMLNIKKNFQNAKELRSSFIISIIGMGLNDCAFVILWLSFGQMVGNINGWGKYDIIGLYGFCTTAFGLVFSLFQGIQYLPRYISTGNLDKYLLTPKSTIIKIATSAVSTSALGDFIFGFICFIAYVMLEKLSLLQISIYILLIINTSVLYFAYSLICMSASFYFMDGENISTGLFFNFLTPSLYHGGAFNKVLRIIFIFIIPSLLLGAVPVEIVKNISLLKLLGVIAFTIFWLVLSIWFFYKSLRRYESNNFFGFGG